ncbi:DUF2061 domain-containing protein [Halanaerobaculum tunisiense]
MIIGSLRVILKTVSWRITATSSTLLIIYLLTGELKVAGSVALVEAVAKTVIYFVHEKLWDKIKII